MDAPGTRGPQQLQHTLFGTPFQHRQRPTRYHHCPERELPLALGAPQDF